MKSKEISIDKLADAVAKELNDYSSELNEEVKVICEDVAKNTVNTLKQISPKRTGKYAASWSKKVSYSNQQGKRIVVFNKDYYQLTSILEYGHQKINGGRVEGKQHISIAEKQAKEELEKRIKDLIKKWHYKNLIQC